MNRKILLISVIILVIATPFAIVLGKHLNKRIQRFRCGTNLKGLGKAQTVYANDYDDEYMVQGSSGANLKWGTVPHDPNGNVTVGASLYLLVKEADVSPQSFVCADSNDIDTATGSVDIVELWDFENEPQSYDRKQNDFDPNRMF